MVHQEKLNALGEDLMEVDTVEELDAMLADMYTGYVDYLVHPQTELWLNSTRLRLECGIRGRYTEDAQATVVSTPMQRTAVARTSRQYKLLKDDVSWSTKPQVHAVMRILMAHMSVGEVVDEADIVRMMEQNEGVLATTQGGRRIWDYYKGNNAEGLQAHGNVERI